MTTSQTLEAIEAEFRDKQLCFCSICEMMNDGRAFEVLKSSLLRALSTAREGTKRERDIPKLGSENQDTYVAYAHGYNDCREETDRAWDELLKV